MAGVRQRSCVKRRGAIALQARKARGEQGAGSGGSTTPAPRDAPAEPVPHELRERPPRGHWAQRLRRRERAGQRVGLWSRQHPAPAWRPLAGLAGRAGAPAWQQPPVPGPAHPPGRVARPPTHPPTCMAAVKSRWPRAASKMSRRTASFFHLSVQLKEAGGCGREARRTSVVSRRTVPSCTCRSSWRRGPGIDAGYRVAGQAWRHSAKPGLRARAQRWPAYARWASGAGGAARRRSAHRRPQTSSAACSSSRASRCWRSASSTCGVAGCVRRGGGVGETQAAQAHPQGGRQQSTRSRQPPATSAHAPPAAAAGRGAPASSQLSDHTQRQQEAGGTVLERPTAYLARLQQQREGCLLLEQLPHHEGAWAALLLACRAQRSRAGARTGAAWAALRRVGAARTTQRAGSMAGPPGSQGRVGPGHREAGHLHAAPVSGRARSTRRAAARSGGARALRLSPSDSAPLMAARSRRRASARSSSSRMCALRRSARR